MEKSDRVFWNIIVSSLFLTLVFFTPSTPSKSIPLAVAPVGLMAYEKNPCTVRSELHEVRGNSLVGIFESGDIVTILFGYYACHPVNRNDIVVYRYGGNPDPIIKIIKGIPGDSLSLQKERDVWRIMINGKALKISTGEEYGIGERGYQMLSLYIPNNAAIIPPDTYLILGNLVQGSLDSTRFGLVNGIDIEGKVNPLVDK